MSASNLFRPKMTPWAVEKSADDEPKGMVYSLKEATTRGNPLEQVLLEIMAKTLEHHYPAPKGMPFWWAVEVNGSVAYIFNLALSGRQGYVLHTKGLTTEKVINAGGEILERYGVPREARNYSLEKILALHEASKTRFLKAYA